MRKRLQFDVGDIIVLSGNTVHAGDRGSHIEPAVGGADWLFWDKALRLHQYASRINISKEANTTHPLSTLAGGAFFQAYEKARLHAQAPPASLDMDQM